MIVGLIGDIILLKFQTGQSETHLQRKNREDIWGGGGGVCKKTDVTASY